jgi:hypothetical protein
MDLSYGSVTNVTFTSLVWRFTSAVTRWPPERPVETEASSVGGRDQEESP